MLDAEEADLGCLIRFPKKFAMPLLFFFFGFFSAVDEDMPGQWTRMRQVDGHAVNRSQPLASGHSRSSSQGSIMPLRRFG